MMSEREHAGFDASQSGALEAHTGFNNPKHNCNSARLGRHCGEWSFVCNGVEQTKCYKFRCKGYRCARCGPRKLRLVRKRIVEFAQQRALTRFLTLTLDPKKMAPNLNVKQKIKYLRECWRKMRVSLRRKAGKSIDFVMVLELQANGNPHLHALIGSYLNKSWISRAWQAVGGGSFTRIEFVNIRRVARYLSKYVTDRVLRDLPSGVRRFSTSRGFVLFPKSCEKKTNTVLSVVHVTQQHERLLRRGIPVTCKFESDGNEHNELVEFSVKAQIDVPHFQRPGFRWFKTSEKVELCWELETRKDTC